MAKPIGNTPELRGKEATEFIENMFKPIPEEKKIIKHRLAKQRKVLF